MSNREHGSISAIECGKCLTYGIWDGKVYSTNDGVTNCAVLNSPATAICSVGETVYVGTSCGDVWTIKNKEVAKIGKAGGGIVHKDISLEAVIGIHPCSADMVVVVYIFGEISIYKTDTNQKISKKTKKIEGKITSSYLENSRLLCIIDSAVLEIHDMEENEAPIRIKSLLSNTLIDQAIFMPETEQNVIVYSTPIGKVCVDYVNRQGTGFVFKAHKLLEENKEIYYPVTLLKGITPTRLITGGVDGNVYLWNIKERSKVKTVIATEKCIVMGDIRHTIEKERKTLILVLSNRIADGLCSIEDSHEIIEVELEENL